MFLTSCLCLERYFLPPPSLLHHPHHFLPNVSSSSSSSPPLSAAVSSPIDRVFGRARSLWICVSPGVSSIQSSVQPPFFTPTLLFTHPFIPTHTRTHTHTHTPPAVGVFGRHTHPSWTSLRGVDDRADDESSPMQMETQLPRSICRRGVCVCVRVCVCVCVEVYPAGPWLEGSPVAC